MQSAHIPHIRSFNRLVTQRIGALQDSYLSRGRPLGEARLIFEIGSDGADLRDLRGRLNLDSGYLSRLLRSLEGQGLVTLTRDASDSRVRRATLTAKGGAEFEQYDRLSDELAASMLNALGDEEQKQLVDAMRAVERLLKAASTEFAMEPPTTADARGCLDAYFAELARRFEEGFDTTKGNKVSDAEMTPPNGFFLVARRAGEPIGCGALLRVSDEVAEIKRMWIAPAARGQGLARRLVEKLEGIARQQGFRKIWLDTNRSLREAQALYRRQGYAEISRYNDNPYADHWFEKLL